MIKNDLEITSMMYGDVVKQIAEQKGIGLTEARMELAQMSFSQYNNLINEANITPPSGNTIGPAAQTSAPKSAQAAKGPSQIKAIWPGSGAPLEVGMTVGLKDKSGKPVPGQVSQVDMGANGVKVKNPTTGQDEWMNTDTLEPFMVDQEQQPGTPTQEDNDLMRLKELAGIRENCSGGATGAGAIAIAPAAMGKVKRRQETTESPKKEYTPKGPAKTIVGDTKPAQASGELSATLAANGRKTASRSNNGFKR